MVGFRQRGGFAPRPPGFNAKGFRAFGGFVPNSGLSESSVPGLLQNIDFSDTSTITLNGSTISQVRDKSGNSRHFDQATAVNQPTFNATGINGIGAAQFDGVDDYMIGNAAARAVLSGRQTYTTIDVVKWTSAAVNNFAWFYSTAASASTSLASLYYATTPAITSARRRISTDGGNNANLGTGLNTTHVIVSTVTYATPLQVTRVDAVQKTSSGSGLTTGVMNTETALAHLIGSSTGAAGFLVGYYGQRLIYDHVLTTAEQTFIEALLKAKWGTP